MNRQALSPSLCPEHWLVVSDDSARLFALRTAIVALRSPLAAWRLKHGLIKLLPAAGLEAALAAALATRAPIVRLHTDAARSRVYALLAGMANPTMADAAMQRLRVDPLPERDHSAVLAEVARPDAWVELGWSFGAGAKVPPLRAGDDTPDSVAEHEQAFLSWASTPEAAAALGAAAELNGLLDELDIGDDGAELEDDATDVPVQPEPGADDEPGWRERLQQEASAFVSPAGPLQLAASPGALAAAPASARAAQDLQLLHIWVAPKPSPGPGRRPGLYEARLFGDRLNTLLTLELDLLDPDQWVNARDLQIWLFPSQMSPVQVAFDIEKALSLPGKLVLKECVFTHGRDVVALAGALPSGRLHLDFD